MALTLIKDADLKKGITSVSSDETIASPVMKEPITNICRCKNNSCNCIRNSVNGRPLEFNLQKLMISQNPVFPGGAGLINQLSHIQALLASNVSHDSYPGEIFAVTGQNWAATPNYSEINHVSSSVQIAEDLCTPSKRRKKKNHVTTTCSLPLSPPVSASSPLSNGTVVETSQNENRNNHTENNNNNRVNGKVTSNTKNRKYICNACNRSFDYKHVLQNHERTHTGEKPFICRVCRKQFTRDHHLKTHMRLHTGEKPYECDTCQKRFVQVANLRRHIRVHTGEKPYHCEQCNSNFSDSNQLKAHKLIHQDEKPYACDQCNGRYRRKHHFTKHKCPKNGPLVANVKNHRCSSNEVLTTIKDRNNRCSKNEAIITSKSYVEGETVIKKEKQEAVIDDDCRKSLSDDTVSNDSSSLYPASSNSKIKSNAYFHQPWVYPSLMLLRYPPKIPPEQTEPEDLSIKRYHSNNNNSSGSISAEDSPRSTSPMEETNYC